MSELGLMSDGGSIFLSISEALAAILFFKQTNTRTGVTLHLLRSHVFVVVNCRKAGHQRRFMNRVNKPWLRSLNLGV
jgi:hypothetical protein